MSDVDHIRAALIGNQTDAVRFMRADLDRALDDAAHWRHRAMVLGAEVTARNAANIELGRQLAEFQHEAEKPAGGEQSGVRVQT